MLSIAGSQQLQAGVDATGLIYIDPIGAVLISIYIIANWIITGWGKLFEMLTSDSHDIMHLYDAILQVHIGCFQHNPA